VRPKNRGVLRKKVVGGEENRNLDSMVSAQRGASIEFRGDRRGPLEEPPRQLPKLRKPEQSGRRENVLFNFPGNRGTNRQQKAMENLIKLVYMGEKSFKH